jgi:acetyl esterase/lipase
LKVKTEPFFGHDHLLDPNFMPDYLYPKSLALPVIASSPAVYYPQDSPNAGQAANPRMNLTRLYLQRGEWLDYYTGDHHLSERLRGNPSEELVPEEHRCLLPQFGVTSSWPATFIYHAKDDESIPFKASMHLREILESKGVEVTFRAIDGKNHLFDCQADAEGVHGIEGGLFDEVITFLTFHLQK